MNITLDDPRLTSYVLDDLDQAERSVIEAEMQNFGECRHEIAEIIQAATFIRAALASEPIPALAPAQRRAIEDKLTFQESKPKLSWIPSLESGERPRWLLKIGLALALMLLLCAGSFPVADGSLGLDRIQSFSQNATADTAYVMTRMVGTKVSKDGLVLILPGDLAFKVAPNCSAINYTLALLVASLLLGNLYLRSLWKRLSLALFVIPLEIVATGFRVFTIAELCAYFGPSAINSPIHHHSGPIFFALALGSLIFFLVWLRKLEARHYRAIHPPPTTRSPS